MTNEEAISIMNVIIHMLEPQYDTERVEDAVSMAIKALEQQSVIDKIRAEIEAEPYISKMEVLDIIDKYKAESEDREQLQ